MWVWNDWKNHYQVLESSVGRTWLNVIQILIDKGLDASVAESLFRNSLSCRKPLCPKSYPFSLPATH